MCVGQGGGGRVGGWCIYILNVHNTFQVCKTYNFLSIVMTKEERKYRMAKFNQWRIKMRHYSDSYYWYCLDSHSWFGWFHFMGLELLFSIVYLFNRYDQYYRKNIYSKVCFSVVNKPIFLYTLIQLCGPNIVLVGGTGELKLYCSNFWSTQKGGSDFTKLDNRKENFLRTYI